MFNRRKQHLLTYLLRVWPEINPGINNQAIDQSINQSINQSISLPVNLELFTLLGRLLSTPILFITLSFSSAMLSLSRQLCPHSWMRQLICTSRRYKSDSSRNRSPVQRAVLTTARFLKLSATLVAMKDSMSEDILAASESIMSLCLVNASSWAFRRLNCFSQMSTYTNDQLTL